GDLLLDKADLTIIVQRSLMDRNDRCAGDHLPDVQGRQRRVQLPEHGKVVEHRLDHGIDQLSWLITRLDKDGPCADCWDIPKVTSIHTAWDDRSDVIGMRCKQTVDRLASDTHQLRSAVSRRLLGQPIGMSCFKYNRINFVATKRL